MKKNILRVFSLFAILILVCTMVSRFVEDWMTPRVELIKPKDDDFGGAWIHVDAIREDMEGMMVFAAVERVGVQTGLFADRTQVGLGTIKNDQMAIQLYTDQKYVLYSTKTILNGQKIEPLSDMEIVEGEYLVVFPEDEEPRELFLKNCKFQDIRIKDNIVLVRYEEAYSPFMPDQLESVMRKNYLEPVQVYSLREVEEFKAAIPKLIAVCGIILVLVVLWGVLCRVIAKPTKLKVTVVLLLITAGFVGLYFMLTTVYLPSSLLPERNIFDIQHYKTVFRTIEEALALLG